MHERFSCACMNTIINLNKPKGISSQEAVNLAKRMLGVRKAGHAGTLDPIATGILLVCTGEATKVTRFLSDLDKEYVAVVKLGEKTDTLDAEGEPIEKIEGFWLGQEDVERVVAKFTGTIEQTPPMYSAVKVGGRPLYKLARKGITVERAKRRVTVYGVEITGFGLPFVEMRISCSKGTYIRSLCSDIGDALGVGAHLFELTRTRIGDFRLEDSVELDDFGGIARDLSHKSGSISEALSHLNELGLSEAEFVRARKGLPISFQESDFSPGSFIRLNDPSGNLFAIGRAACTEIKIERILHI